MYAIVHASPGPHAELCAGCIGSSVTASSPPFSGGETCSKARQSGRRPEAPERNCALEQASARAAMGTTAASTTAASTARHAPPAKARTLIEAPRQAPSGARAPRFATVGLRGGYFHSSVPPSSSPLMVPLYEASESPPQRPPVPMILMLEIEAFDFRSPLTVS